MFVILLEQSWFAVYCKFRVISIMVDIWAYTWPLTLFSAYPQDPTRRATSSEYILSSFLKVTMTHVKLCTCVLKVCFFPLWKVKRWLIFYGSYLFPVSHTIRTPLPPACPGCLVFLHPNHTVVDIPSQPPSNNLRWLVSTEASTDLLCNRMCWRVSGSMSSHSWDGEKEDN